MSARLNLKEEFDLQLVWWTRIYCLSLYYFSPTEHQGKNSGISRIGYLTDSRDNADYIDYIDILFSLRFFIRNIWQPGWVKRTLISLIGRLQLVRTPASQSLLLSSSCNRRGETMLCQVRQNRYSKRKRERLAAGRWLVGWRKTCLTFSLPLTVIWSQR